MKDGDRGNGSEIGRSRNWRERAVSQLVLALLEVKHGFVVVIRAKKGERFRTFLAHRLGKEAQIMHYTQVPEGVYGQSGEHKAVHHKPSE